MGCPVRSGGPRNQVRADWQTCFSGIRARDTRPPARPGRATPRAPRLSWIKAGAPVRTRTFPEFGRGRSPCPERGPCGGCFICGGRHRRLGRHHGRRSGRQPCRRLYPDMLRHIHHRDRFPDDELIQREFSVEGWDAFNPNMARRHARRLGILRLRALVFAKLGCSPTPVQIGRFQPLSVHGARSRGYRSGLLGQSRKSVAQRQHLGFRHRRHRLRPEQRLEHRGRPRLPSDLPDRLPAATLAPLGPPLPDTRLPGNDLRQIDLPEPDWRLCARACEDEPECLGLDLPGADHPCRRFAC